MGGRDCCTRFGMSHVEDESRTGVDNGNADSVGHEPVRVTVMNLAGDVLYGPDEVAATLTVRELIDKVKVAPGKAKSLMHGERVVADSERMSCFSEALFIMVLIDFTEMTAAIGGAWFGSHYIPKVQDEELGRDVFKLNGVCWFACGGQVNDVPAIPVRVGFRLKRGERLCFGPAVICKINGKEVRRTRLQDALESTGEWEVLDFGRYDAGGTVHAEMVAEDVMNRGQSSKSGLLVDRMVIACV